MANEIVSSFAISESDREFRERKIPRYWTRRYDIVLARISKSFEPSTA